jgi:DNA-binding ferritin-like protein
MKTELKRTLTATLTVATQAQLAHWNFMGPNFLQWHAFLGDVYEDAFEAADTIAEAMRTLSLVVPFSYPSGGNEKGDIAAIKAVATANDEAIAALKTAIAATAAAPDIQNTLQDRLATHEKWAWMLRASGV